MPKNALGFTGIEMIRRIVTVGKVDDLEKLKINLIDLKQK